MAGIFGIKLYYTAITVKAFIDANREQGASEMDLSDVINMSVKDKKEKSDDLQIDMGTKDRMHSKLNDSENFIFNQSFDITHIVEKPAEHELLGLDVPDEEQEKKVDEIDEQNS